MGILNTCTIYFGNVNESVVLFLVHVCHCHWIRHRGLSTVVSVLKWLPFRYHLKYVMKE